MVLQAPDTIPPWAGALAFAPVAAAILTDRLARSKVGEARLRRWTPRRLGGVWLGGLVWSAATMAPLGVLDPAPEMRCAAALFTGLAVVGVVTARWLALHPKPPRADDADVDLDGSA